MRSFLCFVVAIFSVLILQGCSHDASKGAEGAKNAYLEFVDDLRACGQDDTFKSTHPGVECDKDKIWEALDTQTKTQFIDAYRSLARIDRIIEVYFDPVEHKYMRAKTGTDILKSVPINNYKDFFAYMFKPETLVFDENTNSGLQFKKDRVDNENVVVIMTNESSQAFTMVHESDNVWRIAGLRHVVDNALAPIFSSENAMQEYAKGNLEAEIERRIKVRDYFLQEQALRMELLKDK